jgi:3D (Asp-Asp-Asp) domain-containing protein
MLLWQVGRKPMTLHISSKLFVVVLIVAALITAFRTPAKPVTISVVPSVSLAERVDVRIKPLATTLPPRAIAVPVPLVEIKAPAPQTPAEPVAETAPETTPATSVEAAQVPTYTLKSTAYNSHVSQTDSSPDVTATGATTAFGVIAVSRDMLGDIPYGSLVKIKDLGSYRSGRGEGKFQDMLDSQGLFVVEDTMHPRKLEQIDVWFADESQALSWGVRKVELEVVRVGRDGPMLGATVMAAN